MILRFLLTGLILAPLILAAPAAGQDAAELRLVGTWAELQVYPEITTIPFLNATVTRTSVVLLRVEITQTGSSLLLTQTYCSTDIDSGTFLVSTVIPDAFLVSLGEASRPASLDASGTTIRFDQPWYTEVRGCRLADPVNDPLPTSADDPRVFDQDGDGNPGLTVRVSILGIAAGEVYVVQRVRYRLSGMVVTPDRIEGLIEWKNDQVTLDATSSFLEANTNSHPDPAPEHSYFVFRRIQPDTLCEEIEEERKALFGR